MGNLRKALISGLVGIVGCAMGCDRDIDIEQHDIKTNIAEVKVIENERYYDLDVRTIEFYDSEGKPVGEIKTSSALKGYIMDDTGKKIDINTINVETKGIPYIKKTKQE